MPVATRFGSLRGPGRLDVALAVVLAGASAVELGTGFSGAQDAGMPAVTGWHWLFAGLLTVPFAVRSRAPVVVGLGVQAVAAAATGLLIPVEVLSQSVAVFLIAPYTAAVGARSWRGSIAAGVASALLLATAGLLDPRFEPVGSALANAAFAALAWSVAAVVRRYRALADTAAQLAAAQAQLAVEADRRRVARELHDVVAHGLSVVVLRARGAVHDLARDPSSAEAALRDIDRVAGRALADMRRMLAVADDPDDSGREAGPLGPQPALADLPELVGGIADTGLAVSLEQRGDPRPLTAGAELAAYRLVQESLTNVIRHAGASSALVRLEWAPGKLLVTVRDDGRGVGERSSAGPGRGLSGMRQRVELVGGTLRCGPVGDGGFQVQADVPTSP